MGGSQSSEGPQERAAVVNRVDNEQGEVTVEVCPSSGPYLATLANSCNSGWPNVYTCVIDSPWFF